LFWMNLGAKVGHVNVSLTIVIRMVRTALVPRLSVAVIVTDACANGFVGIPLRSTVLPLEALSDNP
jgi:hypothetical protein